jgi:hypothetical protein
MKKAYALVHTKTDFGSRFGPGMSGSTFELYESEAKALAAMEEQYASLADKSYLVVSRHEDGKGFSYGGNMVSFIPGSYYVREHELK